MKIFQHNKTGHTYWMLDDNVIDSTNSRDGTRCVAYWRVGSFVPEERRHVYVREYNEFYEKFTEIDESNIG